MFLFLRYYFVARVYQRNVNMLNKKVLRTYTEVIAYL
jgi:hypothetical protein